ncbi:hypothetical protein A2U01_0096924, partial [Trifolium medium]|nr:hypothetical protein [Trifolium medium]
TVAERDGGEGKREKQR